MIKENLGVFYEDLRKLGTHSLRSGGASDPGNRSRLPRFVRYGDAESWRMEVGTVEE